MKGNMTQELALVCLFSSVEGFHFWVGGVKKRGNERFLWKHVICQKAVLPQKNFCSKKIIDYLLMQVLSPNSAFVQSRVDST